MLNSGPMSLLPKVSLSVPVYYTKLMNSFNVKCRSS
jgi:hypothetical protein